MLKKLLERLAAWRDRAHVATLQADRDYYRDVIIDATRRRADVQRQLDEVTPARQANDWHEVPARMSKWRIETPPNETDVVGFVRGRGGDDVEICQVTQNAIYGIAVFDGERRPFKLVAA